MRSGYVSLTSIIFHGNLLKQVGGKKKRRGKEEREKEGRKQGRKGGSVSFSYF